MDEQEIEINNKVTFEDVLLCTKCGKTCGVLAFQIACTKDFSRHDEFVEKFKTDKLYFCCICLAKRLMGVMPIEYPAGFNTIVDPSKLGG